MQRAKRPQGQAAFGNHLRGMKLNGKCIQLYRMLSTCNAEPMQVLFIWNIWLMQPAVGRLCAGKVLQELQDDGFYAGFPWDLVPTSFLHLHGKERTMCLGSGWEISPPSVPWRTPEKVKVEIGITESCIYWCHDMMVRSKVDGLVAHGLCPQFQDWHLSLNLGQLVWWASLKLSLHIEYPDILQYSTWILPYPSKKSHNCWVRWRYFYLQMLAAAGSGIFWHLRGGKRFFRNQTSPSF